jgi:hypothetical protein
MIETVAHSMPSVEMAAPREVVDPEATTAIAFDTAPTHFRSVWGDGRRPTRVTTGATR